MELFSVTPKVQYGQYTLLNIMTKISVVRENFRKFDVYFPYVIRDGERADTVASDYYGKSTYAWLVMFCNDIVDPYYDWPLTYKQFHDFLQKKYGQVYELRSQISHYKYTGIGGNTDQEIARVHYPMSINTFNKSTTEQKNGWTPVYIYDHELEINESKRTIRLLSNQYINQVDRELNIIFNGR